MSVQIIGTRIPAFPDVSKLLPALHGTGAVSASAAVAYWDSHTLEQAGRAADALGGKVRLVLYTAGGSKPAWQAAQKQWPALADKVDLRFVNPPEGGGIYHVKVGGLEDAKGAWTYAYIGSLNASGSALHKNVEMGIVLHHEAKAQAQLRSYFEETFAAATPAKDIDWAKAISIAQPPSLVANIADEFSKAKIAAPAPSGPVVPEF